MEEPIITKKKKANTYKIATTVLAILLIISVIYNVNGTTGASVADVEENLNSYLNSVPGLDGAEVSEIEKDGCMFTGMVSIQGQAIPVYVSGDGTTMFPTAIPLTQEIPTQTTPTTQTPTEVPKTDKPKFDLFVMSQCPYGTIAEEASFPVVELFGDLIDFNLYFIANDNGDGTFSSLHGQPEVDGDMRQVVIAKEYPALYKDYILCVNENYRDLEGGWEACATGLGIDVNKVKTTLEEQGADLLKENIALAEQLGVGGSPTFYINDAKVSVSRTPEGVKQALCGAFNNAPEELCAQVLEDTQAGAAGSC